jgi:hypothetical protein
MHCDRCKIFISKSEIRTTGRFCPSCGETLRPASSYALDEVHNRNFKMCNRCDSIYYRKDKCLVCNNPRLGRVR